LSNSLRSGSEIDDERSGVESPAYDSRLENASFAARTVLQ
jgi:hypothetical protein